MNQKYTEIEVNGVKYVPKDSEQQTLAVSTDGLSYVIVSCGANGGGIHAGYLKKRVGEEVELVSARRIQYWNGAASISEMALKGVSKPEDCRFTAPVPCLILPKVVEILFVTSTAQVVILAVPVWTK